MRGNIGQFICAGMLIALFAFQAMAQTTSGFDPANVTVIPSSTNPPSGDAVTCYRYRDIIIHILGTDTRRPESGITAAATHGGTSLGGTSFGIHPHLADADIAVAQALAAGATLIRPLQNHFYGDRSAAIRDPFGHEWLIGSQIEQLTPEEMQRRYTALFENP